MMKAGIMQAYFFPYIGYFQLIDASDLFILYENVSFRKKSWITKNRILDKGRKIPVDIGIPINKKSSNKNIGDIIINGSDWKKGMLKQIYFNYKKASFFLEIYPLLEKWINNEDENVHAYNCQIIIHICNYLDIQTTIKSNNTDFLKLENQLLNSDLPREEIKSQRVVEICKNQNVDTYINPLGGTSLYDKSYFQRNDLSLFFLNTKEYEYNQFGSEFVPHLSIIDVLLHNGKEGTKQIMKEYSLI